MFHLSIYCYLNVSSVPLCVLVLDSSNPYSLPVRVVPTFAGGGGRVGMGGGGGYCAVTPSFFPSFCSVCVRESVWGGGWGGGACVSESVCVWGGGAGGVHV